MSDNINEKDLLILSLMYELGSVKAVADHLEMSLSTVRKCVERNTNKLVDMANTEIAMLAPKAVKTLSSAMEEDGSVPKGDIRLKAATEALDRIGAGAKYKQEKEVTATPIILMPQKALQVDPVEVIVKED